MRRVLLQSSYNAEHLMGMAAAHVEWTVDMLDALPDDGQRYELIDGALATILPVGRSEGIPQSSSRSTLRARPRINSLTNDAIWEHQLPVGGVRRADAKFSAIDEDVSSRALRP